MIAGDLFTFTSVTAAELELAILAGNFEDQTFEVTSATINTFTVTMATNATADNTADGACTS
jgi:hypothetical protein